MRSKTAIRTANTRYFVDPSIATAALGIGPNDLLCDLKTMGFLFETMAIRDLRVYAEPIDGTVYHYRDKNGMECDAVVHLSLSPPRWCLRCANWMFETLNKVES